MRKILKFDKNEYKKRVKDCICVWFNKCLDLGYL